VARQALDESEPQWVDEADLVGDADPEARYLIRSISIDRARAISKEHTREVLNRRTHQKDEKRNNDATNDAMLDYALVDWQGVEAKGAALPCDGLANKKRLPGFVIAAIVEYACAGAAPRTPEERAESFRAT
jgi:hypothetical protein